MVNFEIPMNFEGLNQYNSNRSVAGRVQNDYNTAYFMRALFQRAISGATFKLPKAWAPGKRYFKNVLFGMGFIGIVKTNEYGVIPQIATPQGYGLFLQPTELLVAQPLVNMTGRIGVDCEIINLTNDWLGIWDIVEHYAVRLSVAITSVDVSLVNSRISLLAAAKNKGAAETLKHLYEAITAGEPFKVFDGDILKDGDDIEGDKEPFWTFSKDVKNNYITDKLLEDIDTILRQFDNEIGILAMNGKKERMITDEVQAINDDTCARASSWFENLSDSFDRVNSLFPELGLSFTFKYGGKEHEYVSTLNSDRVI